MVYIVFLLLKGGDYSFANFSALNSVSLWPQRFGHPFDIVLKVLKSDLCLCDNKGIGICDVCHKSKQTRELFPINDHISKQNFEFVHCDVWGPYRIPSHAGFRYFLTLIDDKFKVGCVYLLKHKFDVSMFIKQYVHLVKNQLNVSIKSFKSDNCFEFVNVGLREFFSR